MITLYAHVIQGYEETREAWVNHPAHGGSVVCEKDRTDGEVMKI